MPHKSNVFLAVGLQFLLASPSELVFPASPGFVEGGEEDLPTVPQAPPSSRWHYGHRLYVGLSRKTVQKFQPAQNAGVEQEREDM